jgi:hypothetical protein
MTNTDFLYVSRLELKLKELAREYSSKMNSLKLDSNIETSEENRKLIVIERVSLYI